MKQKVIPIGRKVLIRKRKPTEYYPGTTILKTEVTDEYVADIVAVGDAVEGLKVGDVVKYSEHADGIDMTHEDERVQLMNYDMIFAKIVNA
tara:strand:- start:5570 stop:5842 length:273 start_codon:yes stop_codon:yes gene_type:complete